jgi:hypothetical protein
VAAALPIATPIIVPFTPKDDATTAARTAPTAEAKTCFRLTFIFGNSRRLNLGYERRGRSRDARYLELDRKKPNQADHIGFVLE